MNGRAAARSGEWAQHFSNASCFYIEQIINDNLTFFSTRHVYKQPVTSKCVVFAFVISPQIKEIIAKST